MTYAVTVPNANRMRVPDRAGELYVNRLSWPVTAQTNGDKVLIGYLPANCKIHVPDSQIIADGATAAMSVDVCVDVDTNPVVDNQAVSLNTFARAAFSTFSLCETIGVSSNNRPVYLLLNTAPTAAGGNVYVDLAIYDPAA